MGKHNVVFVDEEGCLHTSLERVWKSLVSFLKTLFFAEFRGNSEFSKTIGVFSHFLEFYKIVGDFLVFVGTFFLIFLKCARKLNNIYKSTKNTG